MKVCCVFTLELPHRCDSNVNTQIIIINISKKITLMILNTIITTAMDFFCSGLKNDFETAVVNEPSVLEPLKFYCNFIYRLFLKLNSEVMKLFVVTVNGTNYFFKQILKKIKNVFLIMCWSKI